jgi:hypothetical protein
MDSVLEKQLKSSNAIVLEKLSNTRSKIKFMDTGYIADFYNVNIERGEFKDRLRPSLCGVGYGVMRGDSISPFHKTWQNMINRCHNPTYNDKYKSYSDCSVIEGWYDFRNFREWCEHTHPYNTEVKFELDKDMRLQGNRVYSPETCMWIPKKLNQYINEVKGASSVTGVKGVSPAMRSGEGVTDGVYEVRCADGKGGRVFLGHVNSIEEGSLIYKNYKEGRLKFLAEEYLVSGVIPKATYEIIVKYKIGE